MLPKASTSIARSPITFGDDQTTTNIRFLECGTQSSRHTTSHQQYERKFSSISHSSVERPILSAEKGIPGPSHYSRLISSSKLPPPGPSHYEARRTLWLIPSDEPSTPPSPSPSRIKLETLLSQEGVVEDDEVWKNGLKNVWMGLVGGNQLRKRLPLSMVLKILQAGWQRDGTWPRGEAAPESDQE